jgi:transposase
MRSSSAARPGRPGKAFALQKPHGQLTDRVQAVGPEHFGIACFDCAQARSRWFLADFYGRVLLEPTTVAHTHGDLQAALDRLRQAQQRHDLRDLVVALERTGESHRPPPPAFRQAGYDTRLVHPFTTQQYRQPADPGNKTDDTDRAALFRATTHGFGLCAPDWPALYVSLRLFRRHRRDLVDKTSLLRCQIREALPAALPGYAACFGHLWESAVALALARQLTSAAALRQAGLAGLRALLDARGLRYRQEALHTVLAWAEPAPPGHAQVADWQRILVTLDDDRRAKTLQIQALERTLARLAVQTPYVLLLAIPGVNVVTVADLAGALGPITCYANANAITGRAGLMPSRYQSDQVDHAHGPLRRRGHRRLRAVLMQTADNLVQHNHSFRAQAEAWRRAGKDARWIRVKVSKHFRRLAYAVVAGGQLFPHPCWQQRHYILSKLLALHADHATPLPEQREDLEQAVAWLSAATRVEAAAPLQARLEELARRKRGPQPLAELIPLVLARLGVRVVQSEPESARP